MRLYCYLADSSDPFIQMIRECDSGKSSHSIKRMACRFTAQLRRSLALDDKSQSYTGMHPFRLKVASIKRLKQMQNITVRVAVIFVCGPEAGSLCTGSIVVSLSNRLWT